MRTTGTKSAFTLIEMLVVIVIMLILAGIIIRAASLVSRKSGVGKAKGELEQLQNALNEYYAEYGIYPPCMGFGYEHQGLKTYRNKAFRNYLLRDDSELVPYYNGLVAHLWTRAEFIPTVKDPPVIPLDRVVQRYDEDTARDRAAKKRWAHYLSDIIVDGGDSAPRMTNFGGTVYYSNTVHTVLDPFGVQYQYECRPPYMSYKLWSYGPDRTPGTPDDINANSEAK